MIQKTILWFLDVAFGALAVIGIFIFFPIMFDLFVSPLMFIWTGEMASIVSKAVLQSLNAMDYMMELEQSLLSVRAATGLKGFDLMTTGFWEWQQDFYGRFKIFLLGLVGIAYFWFFRKDVKVDSEIYQYAVGAIAIYLGWPLTLAYLVWPFLLITEIPKLFGLEI